MSGAEIGTLVIAIYGAFLATGDFVWRMWSWSRGRKSIVKVDIANALVGEPDPFWSFCVTARNLSDHEVNVTGVGIKLRDGRTLVPIMPGSYDTMPGVIKPRDRGTVYLSQDASAEAEPIRIHDRPTAGESVDIYGPLAGFVRLATGQEIYSKAKTLAGKG